MNRSVTISLTEEDFLASQRLHARSHLRDSIRSRGFVLAWLVLFAAAAGAFLLLGLWNTATMLALAAAAIVLPLASILLAMLLNRILGPPAARRNFRQQPSLQQTIEFSWSDAGLKARSTRGESVMPWTEYWKWRQDPKILLLYHSDRLYQFIPKRALSPEQMADLVAVMERQRSGAGAVAASSASIGSQT